MKYLILLVLTTAFAGFGFSANQKVAPFLHTPYELSIGSNKSKIGFIYNDAKDASWFYEVRNEINKHPANLSVVYNFLIRFQTYYSHYDEDQINQLLSLAYEALVKVELTDQAILKVERYKDAFNLRIGMIYFNFRKDAEKLEQHKMLVKHLITKRNLISPISKL